ncbi:MAG: nuclear transport factor 2 family protein [Candidatus Acidiferrales bacterium]
MSAEERIRELEGKCERLMQRVGILEDAQAVRALQFKYGYYIDKGLYDEIVDLFSDRCEVHFAGGIYRTKAGARRLYCGRFRPVFTGGRNGPVDGLLLDHMQLQDIIDVAPDGTSAKGRFRCFLLGGFHVSRDVPRPELPRQWWEAGIDENEYVKEAGVWKIKVLNYNLTLQANYETGWANHTPYANSSSGKTYPEDPMGPDEIAVTAPASWPHTFVVPFHYPHPVTGKP